MSAYVYLAFGVDGDLLYVGHTGDVKKRMACHRSTAEWPSLVARLDVETFDSIDEAKWAERNYIADLEPLHNILGNPRHHPEYYEVDAVDAA